MSKKKEVAEPDNHVSGQANNPISRPAHCLTHDEVVLQMKGNAENGLTAAEAKARFEEYGPNEIGDEGGVQPFKILVRQVANAMTLVMRTIPLMFCGLQLIQFARCSFSPWRLVLGSNHGLREV